jgi:hypothetical protein
MLTTPQQNLNNGRNTEAEEDIDTLLGLLQNLSQKKPPYPCLQRATILERLKRLSIQTEN